MIKATSEPYRLVPAELTQVEAPAPRFAPAPAVRRRPSLSERMGRLFNGLASFPERRALWCLGLFSLLYFVSTLNTIRHTPLWMDEIGAYYVARAPLGSMLNILRQGADIQPPLFGWTLHPLAITGNPALIRLPGMIGIWCMSICLYFFVARRRSALYGLIAMLAPFLTGAKIYSYQGRPYGIVLGGSAAALLCWQSLGFPGRKGLKLFGLWLCCTLVVAIHYYGFLILLPLAAGEACRQMNGKREFKVFGVLALSLGPLIAALPIVRAVRAIGMTYLSRVGVHDVIHAYQDFLDPAPVFLCVLLITLLAIWALSRNREAQPETAAKPFPDGELIAVAAFAALPFAGFALALASGAFAPKYVIACVIGLSAGFALIVPARRRIAMAVLLVLGLGVAGTFVSGIRSKGTVPSPVAAAALTPDQQPIVYEGAHQFSADHFYAPHNIADRMFYLTSPSLALKRTGQDTLEYYLQSISHISDLHVVNYQTFLRQHSRFVLVTEKSDAFPWVFDQLASSGAGIRVLSTSGSETIYEVSE